MQYSHTPHPSDDSPPTVAMALGGLPGQRLPSDAPVLDEATREVPVIRPQDDAEPGRDYDGEAAAEDADAARWDPDAQANGEAHDEPDEADRPAEAPEVDGAEEAGEVEEADAPVDADVPAEAVPDTWNTAADTEVTAGTGEADTADQEEQPQDGPMAETPGEEEPMFYTVAAEETEAAPAPVTGQLSALDGSVADAPADDLVASPEEVTEAEAQDIPVDEPAAADTAADEPAAADATTDDALAEDALAEDALAEDPLAEDPLAEDALMDEPSAEDTPAEEPSAADEPAADEPAAAAPLRPGDVAETPIAIWTAEAAQRFRDEWRELQVLFIDEPAVAVAEAKNLVTEVVHTLSDTLLAEQDEFDPRRSSANPDTESMRVAMRRYRDFLERVLAL